MGDIPLSLMIQTELPSNQIGKVYSLEMVMEMGGAALGAALLAPMLYQHVSVTMAIGIGAAMIAATSCVGLTQLGLREPTAEAVETQPVGK